jgi:glycosyltransferase involved in cell wall biosynthesis
MLAPEFSSAIATTNRSSDSPQLHVVLVDEELPYPPVTGKRIRTYNLVARAARRHRLTYVCHRNADVNEVGPARQHFESLGIRTVVVDRPVPPRSGLGLYARLAANLFSALPYSVTSHTSRPLIAALRNIAEREVVDLWHCEWTPYAQAVRDIPGRRVVMAHNVESVIWQRYYQTETNPLRRWYIGKQYRKYLRFERDILATTDLTIAVSDLDAERFRRDLGVRRVDVVDNGVDTRLFVPTNNSTTREPATVLFMGSLEWRPNLDGVAQLVDHVFPAVRQQVPEARLLLVGRNPPPWLRKLADSHPGGDIELHANVPDVRPFLARAGMLVVPLRIGGGSRLKILEALSASVPVVSTRIGAEGLHLAPEQHLSVVEDIADLPEAIVHAIRAPQKAQAIAEVGRRQVLRLYDWEVLADRLVSLWQGVAGSSPEKAYRAGGGLSS